MAIEIYSEEVTLALVQMQQDARRALTKTVTVEGQAVAVPYPFPSPGDWRDGFIYFLMLDRFNNPNAAPNFPWDQKADFRQGGTFKGVQQQLGYIQQMGAQAIWLTPVLKNSRPDGFRYTYPGYDTQDFLNVDERFASDGTRATAERELAELIEEAHGRGLYVIVDIVINHAARVFDYIYNGNVTSDFTDAGVMNAPLGQEPPVEWLNGFGFPRADWRDDLPAPAQLSLDDAVWPADLQRREFFRRRGSKLSDAPTSQGFVPGDFGSLRQLVAEYDATPPDQQGLREKYGITPVIGILIRIYHYLIARYDIDGYRLDTVKYVRPDIVETFGNAMREFALSAGKTNFFTFGEIYDDEATINRFIGRSSSDTEGFGIDAALDFPLFYQLPGVVKGFIGVETIRQVFEDRKRAEKGLISSHGEAGRYFVSFLDNHDQNARFNAPGTPEPQAGVGLALLFCLQGIPCLYYGTEQGLQGTSDGSGHPTLDSKESVREAIWGKTPVAFDPGHPLYLQIRALADLRAQEFPLRYGRLYFREVSGNGQDFGHSQGRGGVIAFSRVLTDRETLIVANTHITQRFDGFALVDRDLSRFRRDMKIGYSNLGTAATQSVQVKEARIFRPDGSVDTAQVAAVPIRLAPMEAQVLVPA
jgi:glycosidase